MSKTLGEILADCQWPEQHQRCEEAETRQGVWKMSERDRKENKMVEISLNPRQFNGKDSKVKMLIVLRNTFEHLGLKEAKDLVEAPVFSLTHKQLGRLVENMLKKEVSLRLISGNNRCALSLHEDA
jgi:ribosomal protein L7/L12